MSYFVYIMTNATHSVLYTGVTNDLARRIHEHSNGKGSVFTKRYQIRKLVFWERFEQSMDAIAAEKRIKAGSRKRKIGLIEELNPLWGDLAGDM
jgi:putative endonuclease